jgi:hypothetical protein
MTLELASIFASRTAKNRRIAAHAGSRQGHVGPASTHYAGHRLSLVSERVLSGGPC